MNNANGFKNMKWFLRGICVVMVLFSAGCSASVTPTSIAVPATMSLTPFPTTLRPSATLSSTPTRTPAPPTLTPLPILGQPEEIKTKLFELLLNNGGCRLPCLLGHTPGIVSLQEMKNFFDQFGLLKTQDMLVRKGTSNDGSLSGVSFYFPYLQDIYLNMHISAYKNGNQVEALAMDAFPQSNWDFYYAEIVNYYLVPQILMNYGEPSQVLVWTIRDDRQRPDVTTAPFFLALLYPDQGFYLQYEMSRETKGANFLGCPSKAFVSVGVWPPKDEMIFNKMMQVMTNGNGLSPYKSIEEAASLTINEFVETYSKASNSSCLVTPIETWPNP